MSRTFVQPEGTVHETREPPVPGKSWTAARRRSPSAIPAGAVIVNELSFVLLCPPVAATKEIAIPNYLPLVVRTSAS
jgi:hypothetical protein